MLKNHNNEDYTIPVTTLGIDLAKSVFHLHGVDDKGKITLRKRMSGGFVA